MSTKTCPRHYPQRSRQSGADVQAKPMAIIAKVAAGAARQFDQFELAMKASSDLYEEADLESLRRAHECLLVAQRYVRMMILDVQAKLEGTV